MPPRIWSYKIMEKKCICACLALFLFSNALFADENTAKNIFVENRHYLYRNYVFNGQIVRNTDELKSILTQINDTDVNESLHFTEVFTNLAIPPAIFGVCVVMWGLFGRMARGERFDPYIFGSGAALLGGSLVFMSVADIKMNSAVQKYNAVVLNRNYLSRCDEKPVLNLCFSRSF